MEYTLKNKIQINKEFLADLETKSWQEIEHLQSQIANISETYTEIIQLFKNLLTSYYIFVGGLEGLSNTLQATKPADIGYTEKETVEVNPNDEKVIAQVADEQENFFDESETFVETNDGSEEHFEPFEYFVDFDEPTGEPLTDDDIYN